MTDTSAATIPAIYTDAYNAATEGGSNTTGYECVVCGKNTRRKGKVAHVRVSQGEPGGLVAVPHDADLREEDDLGCFPVGPECAKRFPSNYIERWEINE